MVFVGRPNLFRIARLVKIQSNTLLARTILKQGAQDRKREVVDLTLRLLGKSSENPPGDTRDIAREVVELFAASNIDAKIHASATEIHNVVARVRGNGKGPRLILNGHLDTFPLGNLSDWTV